MRPAARLTDFTAHAAPLVGVCSHNVLIGSMPAWRLADVNICPMPITPPPLTPAPHGPEVTITASATVLINGMPAARMGDSLTGLFPNVIVSGCVNVLIGG